MKEIGEKLKETRKKNGVSLEEASNDLSINAIELENLENGNFKAFKDVFELKYLENHGAAFGVLQNQRFLLLLITIVILGVLCFLYSRIPVKKRYFPLRAAGILLAAGAVGNMIDRFINGYVVDFFYFKWIDFPIFNVADCYVVVAAVLAFFLVCFYYKDEDFDFLKKDKKS